ncbi:MAG: hypothetical protein ABSA04_07865 [Desulfobaccales bacterium]|jgi:hypothetical protein
MSTESKDNPARAVCTGCWCHLWTFTANTARRARILGRYTLACWQQQKIRKATRLLGEKTFQTLERGEANPLVAPEVSEAVQKVKDLTELKEKNYLAIAAIREKIRSSCVIATPEEPGSVKDNPPLP